VIEILAGATGLEPATFGVTGRLPHPNPQTIQHSILLAGGANEPQCDQKCHGVALPEPSTAQECSEVSGRVQYFKPSTKQRGAAML
jgi:hypothetical protein